MKVVFSQWLDEIYEKSPNKELIRVNLLFKLLYLKNVSSFCWDY